MPTMSMSACGGKADIPDTPHQCPLMTQSGRELPWSMEKCRRVGTGLRQGRSIIDGESKLNIERSNLWKRPGNPTKNTES